MQAYSIGRYPAVAVFIVAAIALAANPSIAQSTSGRAAGLDTREIEHLPPVRVPPVSSAKEPDTAQDVSEHQERLAREKATLDYDRRVAEAAERQAAAADRQNDWSMRQVALGGFQALILLGILIAVIWRPRRS